MKLLNLAIFAAMTAATLYGQTGLATVTGTILDPTGAILSNAPVQLINSATGQVFSAASSDTGNYTVSQVPVGDYSLTVMVMGFKTYSRPAFHLAAAQILREDITLEIGTSAETVTVTAETSLLKTESSELVHNVTISQMQDLPILPVGSTGAGFRDPFAVVRLMPGASYVAGSTMVINGNPDDTVQIRIEGQTANNTGDRLRGTTQQSQPSADAVEEVAVQTSNYSAEYGTAGGGVMNVVMKSGTNKYHGTAYDYMVNEALNAHQPYNGLRSRQRRNDWGFTFGGPVWIPKLYDGRNKTFFFWNYEQYRENTVINTLTPTVPIQAYRDGNFAPLIGADNNRPIRVNNANYVDPLGLSVMSGMIFDPLSTQPAPTGSNPVRQQFVNNAIPATRFDPVSVRVLSLVPRPQGPNHNAGLFGTNFNAPVGSNRLSDIPSIKIDQSIGSKGRLSFYTQETGTAVQYAAGPGAADGFPLPITGARGTFVYATTARVNYDHTLSPTMLLHLGAGWTDLDFSDRAPVTDFNAQTALGLRGSTLNRTFPIINVGGSGAAQALNSATGGMTQLGPTPQGDYFERRPAGNVSLNWVRGSHTLKFGAEYRLEKFLNYDFNATSGNYGLASNYTLQTSLQGLTVQQGFHGFPFASFLLGGLSSVSLNAPINASTSKSQWALFIQDNWKATRKLTVDYGLRWDYGTYAKEQYGRYGNFSPTIANASAGGHPGGRIYEATCNCKFANNYPYAIGPRLGLAYQINQKTVIRGGIGVVFNSTFTAAGSSVNSSNAGTPGFGQIVGLFKDGIPANVAPVWPNFDANAGQPVGAVIAAPAFLDPNAGRPARQVQWSLSVQRELNRNLVFEASYVANRGVWWSRDGATDASLTALNVYKEADIRRLGFNDFTSLAESNLLNTPIANLSTIQRSTLRQRGIDLPYSNFPTTLTARQSILPFPQYTGTLAPSQAPLGKTWYDGLQMNLTQRFSHGLTLNANYTYSKTLDLMSATDIFNRGTGKDASANDVPHTFRISAEYQVPRMNTQLPVLRNKAVSYALSGWGIGWYSTYQSAAVLGRASSQGSVPLNNFLGRGPGSAQLKKDANGNYMNPWSVDWVDYDGNHRTDPIDINCRCFDPTKTLLLNPAVWENVPDGQWAADFSTIRWFRGLRRPAESANFSRNFRIKEGVLLHVRVEFQNIFNRTVLPQVSVGNFNALPVKFTTGTNIGLYSSGFGTINPTAGTSGQRAGTLIGRITF
jgi:hypothetical protein